MATKTIVRRIYVPKRRSRSRSQGMTVSTAAIAGMVPLGLYAYDRYKTGGISGAASGMCAALTGWDTTSGSFDWKLMWHGTFPILIGIGVHKAASKLGINRMLAKAGIPFFRV